MATSPLGLTGRLLTHPLMSAAVPCCLWIAVTLLFSSRIGTAPTLPSLGMNSQRLLNWHYALATLKSLARKSPLWEVCRPDLVTPVTRRSRNPLGRVVGVPSLWRDLVEFFNSTGWAFSFQVAAPMWLPDAGPLPGSNLSHAGFWSLMIG
jgi:hypothetical protein